MGAPVEVGPGRDEFVTAGDRLGHDLPGGCDDRRLGERLDAFLDAALGHADHPRAVLVGTGLHDEVVVEALQRVLAGVGGVVDRCVVADEDQLDALEAHLSVGLGPAPIVAGGHTDQTAECPPDTEPVGRFLEVAPFEVLERTPRFVVRVTRDVDLAILAHDRSVALDQNGGVVAMAQTGVVGLGQLGVPEGEPDAEPPGLVEQRLRLGAFGIDVS